MGGGNFSSSQAVMTHSNSLNDLKSSEVKFSKLLLGKILLKVHQTATDVNQCGKSWIQQLPHKFSQPSQKTTSIRIFYFNYYSLIKDLYRQFCQFLRETFQDLKTAFFPFNTVFPLNIILYQLSYSPGVQRFTIQTLVNKEEKMHFTCAFPQQLLINHLRKDVLPHCDWYIA